MNTPEAVLPLVSSAFCLVYSIWTLQLRKERSFLVPAAAVYAAAQIAAVSLFRSFAAWLIAHAAGYLAVHLVCRMSAAKKAFTYGTAWLFALVFSKVVYFIPLWFPNHSEVIHPALFLAVAVIYLFFYVKYMVRTFRAVLDSAEDRVWLFSCSYPLGCIAMISVFMPMNAYNSILPCGVIMQILLLVMIAAIYHVVCFSIRISYEYGEMKGKLRNVTYTLDKQKEYYAGIVRYMDEAKILRHDMRFHITTLQVLVAEGNVTAAAEYLNHLNRLFDQSRIVQICENTIVNAIVSAQVENARAERIAMRASVSVADDLGIDDLDLCVVFGNCIENAIEACQKLPAGQERYIALNSVVCGEQFLLMIQNPYCGARVTGNGDPKSGKPAGGLGLKSVRAVVERYGGEFTIDAADGKFTVCIMMPRGLAGRERREERTALPADILAKADEGEAGA